MASPSRCGERWAFLDADVAAGRLDRVREVLGMVAAALCDLVPSRTDIHALIEADLQQGLEEGSEALQTRLVAWVERFQAPIYDAVTARWRRDLPMPSAAFLDAYLPHLRTCLRQREAHIAQMRSGTLPMRAGR